MLPLYNDVFAKACIGLTPCFVLEERLLISINRYLGILACKLTSFCQLSQTCLVHANVGQ